MLFWMFARFLALFLLTRRMLLGKSRHPDLALRSTRPLGGELRKISRIDLTWNRKFISSAKQNFTALYESHTATKVLPVRLVKPEMPNQDKPSRKGPANGLRAQALARHEISASFRTNCTEICAPRDHGMQLSIINQTRASLKHALTSSLSSTFPFPTTLPADVTDEPLLSSELFEPKVTNHSVVLLPRVSPLLRSPTAKDKDRPTLPLFEPGFFIGTSGGGLWQRKNTTCAVRGGWKPKLSDKCHVHDSTEPVAGRSMTGQQRGPNIKLLFINKSLQCTSLPLHVIATNLHHR